MVIIAETKLIVPPGKKTGCLYRTTKPGELCSLFGEKIGAMDPDEWEPFIGKMKLSPSVLRIHDQNGVGSCATNASTGVVETLKKFLNQPVVPLNPWFVYYHTSGGRDQGSNIDSNLAFIRDKGIAPLSVWGRDKGWRTRPSGEAYEAALPYRIDEFFDVTTTAEVGTSLIKGWPVVFGWSSHSCYLVELVSKTHAIYVNSWGKGWNNGGLGTIKLSSINFGYGAWSLRSTYLKQAA